MSANCSSLAVRKLVAMQERKIVARLAGEVAHIHNASQLLVANDKHLEILPVERISISTKVLRARIRVDKLLDSSLLLVSSHYTNSITAYPFVELGFPVLQRHENCCIF